LENNTSQHLWKSFLAKKSQKISVDPTLLEQQNQLRIAALSDESAKQKLIEIDEKINQQVSRYTENKFEAIDIAIIQEKLKTDEAILRFLPTTDWLFAVAISKNSLQIKKIGSIDDIDSLTQVHYKHLTTIDKNFPVSAKDLFMQLIQSFDFKNIEKLTVISEGSLLSIPFESLMNEDGKPLGIEKNVTYAPSLYFLNTADRKDYVAGRNLVAFAPEYNAPSYSLENTSLEVETLKKSMGGKIFDKYKATKQAFLDNLLDYQVQHLAMHATMDTAEYENSSLLFANNESLSFSEIYQLTIPAEMVTLSACNTGVGTLVNGEGLMSLSRALLYAGTSSVVHSLWRVPDEETAEIMGYFYQNLSEGMPKGMALQEAKKAFIKHNPLKQHPYFWTGFVLIGDTSPLDTSNDYRWWLLGLLALAFIYIFFRRRSAFSRQTVSLSDK
jgi:CHAT domain-containing protein